MPVPEKELRPSIERYVGLSKEQIRNALRQDLSDVAQQVAAIPTTFTLPPPPKIERSESVLQPKGGALAQSTKAEIASPAGPNSTFDADITIDGVMHSAKIFGILVT